MEAVPVGADLSNVYNLMEIFNLEYLETKLTQESDKENCKNLISLHQKVINGIEVKAKEWKEVYDLAYLAYLADINREKFIEFIKASK